MTLKLATRRSALALAQATDVQKRLQALHPGLEVELVHMDALGDESPAERIAQFGQEGVFVKALEQSVAAGQAHAAVHSLKDVPTTLHDGLVLAAWLEREDPRDVLVARDPAALLAKPQGKRIGTSSLRRQAFLTRHLEGVKVEELRGNLDTRLGKAMAGALDGVVVALAGLKRLGRTDLPHQPFGMAVLPPAPGQGVVVVQCCADDEKTAALLAPLSHRPTELCARAEREFLRKIQGGCLVPVGVRSSFIHEDLDLLLEGWIISPQGDLLVHGLNHQRREAPEAIGAILASRLWQHGGGAIINRLRGVAQPGGPGDSAVEPSG